MRRSARGRRCAVRSRGYVMAWRHDGGRSLHACLRLPVVSPCTARQPRWARRLYYLRLSLGLARADSGGEAAAPFAPCARPHRAESQTDHIGAIRRRPQSAVPQYTMRRAVWLTTEDADSRARLTRESDTRGACYDARSFSLHSARRLDDHDFELVFGPVTPPIDAPANKAAAIKAAAIKED